MKTKQSNSSRMGYTLVEVFIGMLLLLLVSAITYTIILNSSVLLAKNVSLNSSTSTLGFAVDRITTEIAQANGLPTLINADGTVAAASAPAAGIVFDHYRGGPYVVSNPGGLGLLSTVQSLSLTFATDAVGSLPVPEANDVIRPVGYDLRLLVNSADPAVLGLFPPPIQPVTALLKAPIGRELNWDSGFSQTAFLLHRRAIVVVPNNGRNELRYYYDVETLLNRCDLRTPYVVLNSAIGAKDGEGTPFSVVTQEGNSFIKIAMRIEDQQYQNVLANQQAPDSNTFLRADTYVRPRNLF